MAPRAPAYSVKVANDRALKALAKKDAELAQGPLAAASRRLAEGLDADNSLTSKAMASKQLDDLWVRLRELAPKDAENDDVAALEEPKS